MSEGAQSLPELTAYLAQNPMMAVILVAVVIVEYGLMIYAFVDWIRRAPHDINGNRFLWLILILLLNIVGPIVYLLFGRKAPAAVDTPGPASDSEAAAHAVDTIYGSGKVEPE